MRGIICEQAVETAARLRAIEQRRRYAGGEQRQLATTRIGAVIARLRAEYRLSPRLATQNKKGTRHATHANMPSQNNCNCSPTRAGGWNKSQRNGTRLRPSPSRATAASNLRRIIDA